MILTCAYGRMLWRHKTVTETNMMLKRKMSLRTGNYGEDMMLKRVRHITKKQHKKTSAPPNNNQFEQKLIPQKMRNSSFCHPMEILHLSD